MLDASTFDGVTVLDFSRLLPGPFCTMLLADLGARVLKVEAPRGGDYARWYPPQVNESADGYGALFAAVNRGKESVSVDTRDPDARRLVDALIERADVIVDTFRPGVMARIGLDAGHIRALNPRCIIARITGFGQTGPDAHRAGHDIGYLARAGVLGETGPHDGAPASSAVQIADIAGGALYAAFGIAAALYRRERTGQGAELDISMTEGAASLLVLQAAGERLAPGTIGARGRGLLTGGVPAYRCYRTADDRWLAVGSLEPKFFAAFCAIIDRPDLVTDGLREGPEGEKIAAQLAAAIAGRTLAEWREALADVDACVEPVQRLAEVFDDAHLQARGAFDGLGLVRPPTSPAGERGEVPLLGEHTRAVAEEVGLGDALEGWVERGVARVTDGR